MLQKTDFLDYSMLWGFQYRYTETGKNIDTAKKINTATEKEPVQNNSTEIQLFFNYLFDKIVHFSIRNCVKKNTNLYLNKVFGNHKKKVW